MQAKEVATRVHQKRDLGCKTTHEPYVIEEQKQESSNAATVFWELLGGYAEYQGKKDTDAISMG